MEAKRKILITGASGFIGTHLVTEALARNMQVYALVRKRSKIKFLKNVIYLYADILNLDELRLVFNDLRLAKIKLDYIIHAAALTKANSKTKIDRVNYKGTYNLYKCLEELTYTPEKVLFISSLAAAGPEKINNYISLKQAKPITTYGVSKLKAEYHILNETNVPTVIVRPTAVYGPGDKDLYSIFKLIQANFNPILGYHQQQLTFIYVKDLIEIIYCLLINGEAGKIYFATDGNVYDKFSLPNAISKSLNRKPLTITFPLFIVKTLSILSQYSAALLRKTSSLNMEKYNELIAESWMCNAECTFLKLNYFPKYDLNSGVRETSEWYKINNWLK